MSNPWFRMYSEFAFDPKVQMMPETYQRRLLMLLCLRCNGDATLQDVAVMFQLRISEQDWLATKAEFVARGFIDSDNNLLNWNKRQYQSDSSTERSRKHREAKKTSNATQCNVAATAPDTEQNRTDTEQKEKKKTKGKKDSLGLEELTIDHNAEWLAKKRSQGRYMHHDEHFVLDQFKQYCRAKGKKYADYLEAYRNAFEWDKCQPRAAGTGGGIGKSEWTSAAEQLIAEDRAKAARFRSGPGTVHTGP